MGITNQREEYRVKVSLVMGVYNGEEYLKEAIESILGQTYPNLEIIIVNDGSTDSTKNILDDINDKRVKIIHLEKNQGAANALNIGIIQAKGSWIAIQDADDNSYPTRIEEQVKYIVKHPELLGVGTFIECISGSSGISDEHLRHVAKSRNSLVSREKIRDIIYWGCPFTHSSVMFSKNVFLKVGGYNPSLKIAYDHDLWLRLLEIGEMENVPKVLLQYRIHKQSLSHRDDMATVNEIQISSSRGIYRRFNRNRCYPPRVVVIGPKKACRNYNKYVAPVTGLEVKAFIYKDWNKQIPYFINMIKKRKINAIIVLDGYEHESIIKYLEENKLNLNDQVFNIYNILE